MNLKMNFKNFQIQKLILQADRVEKVDGEKMVSFV